jgi:hypothetical protein
VWGAAFTWQRLAASRVPALASDTTGPAAFVRLSPQA